MNVDGIKDLEEEDTSPFTLAVLANMNEEESPEYLLLVQDEISQAALARTILTNVKKPPVYRASGVKTGSGKPKVKTTQSLNKKQLPEAIPTGILQKNE